jgi:two-component system, OmpR family, sensor histidine kinase CreC
VKIRTRIIIGFLLLIAAGFTYLTRWVLTDVRPHYLKSMEESLIDMTTLLSSQLASAADDGRLPITELRAALADAANRRFSAKVYNFVKDRINLRVYVTDERGFVVFDSDNGRDEGKDYSKWNDIRRTLHGEYGARATRIIAEDENSSWLYVASPVVVNGKTIGVVSIGKPALSINLFVLQARNKIVAAALIAGFIVIGLGILLSIWITSPIKRLTRFARNVRDGRRERLPDLGTSEFAVMGNALEEMREALEGKKYIERYVQTLTHEIKSPVTAITGAAELLSEEIPLDARRSFIANIRTESTRIQQIVERLLQLASVENRNELRDVESLALIPIVREVAESMRPTLASKQIELRITGPDDIACPGERFLVRQSVANLLQNAIDFTPAGGRITGTVDVEAGFARVTFDDSGCGIPDYATSRIFERFYSITRPDTGRKSTGLGLSFVREAAELHGGSVTVENREGGGVRARLMLPVKGHTTVSS